MKSAMKTLVFLLPAVACVISACSPKDEPCDMTGKRYGKMMEEGTPLTEKDKACLNAVMLKGFEDQKNKLKTDMEKQKTDEKTNPQTQKPVDWSKALNLKKSS